MKTTEKDKKRNYEWKKKNKKTLVCIMYKQDAEDFQAFCRDQGRSVNDVLRGFVADCLGRPLERRDGTSGGDPGETVEDSGGNSGGDSGGDSGGA